MHTLAQVYVIIHMDDAFILNCRPMVPVECALMRSVPDPSSSCERAGTQTSVVDCSRIKWAWLQSLAVHNHSFVLNRGIKLVRLGFTAVYQVTYLSYIP